MHPDFDVPGATPPPPVPQRPAPARPLDCPQAVTTTLWLTAAAAVVTTLVVLIDLVIAIGHLGGALTSTSGSTSRYGYPLTYVVATGLAAFQASALGALVLFIARPRPGVRTAAFVVLGAASWHGFVRFASFVPTLAYGFGFATWTSGAVALCYLGVALLSVPAILLLASRQAAEWFADGARTP